MKHIDYKLMKTGILPTPTHFFHKLMLDKGIIHQLFTQNTDDLFIDCGLSDDQIIHAHGRVGNAVCAVCGTKDSTEAMFEAFEKGEVMWCKSCAKNDQKGPIKPNVVFFNEAMPKEFHEQARPDALKCVDLLLILGTTLKVKPFSMLPNRVPKTCP